MGSDWKKKATGVEIFGALDQFSNSARIFAFSERSFMLEQSAVFFGTSGALYCIIRRIA